MCNSHNRPITLRRLINIINTMVKVANFISVITIVIRNVSYHHYYGLLWRAMIFGHSNPSANSMQIACVSSVILLAKLAR
jgi:hypothetical protein